MTSATIAVRENRLRRWATRMGWVLEKSRARILREHDRGKYRLSRAGLGVVVGASFDASLDEIEAALAAEQRRLRE